MGVRGTRGSDVMRLSMSLLTLLIYVSDFGSSAFKCSTSPQSREVPKYEVCGTDTLTRQSFTEDLDPLECWYTESFSFDPCGFDTSPTAPPCWKVLDGNGTVEVSFPLLPQRCQYTSYEAKLRVFESSDHKCLNYSNERTHSEKRVSIENCSKPSCSGSCIQRGILVFRHVFSGCYQLLLIPYLYQQPYIIRRLETGFSYLSTEHVKTPIQSEMEIKPEVTSDGLSLKATFCTNPTTSRFKLMQDVDISSDQEACRKTGTCIATCDTFLDQRYITCDSDGRKSNVSCSYQSEKVISCEFSHLKAGNYCVRLAFYDDRCSPNTVWDNSNDTYPKCMWETDIIEIIPKEPRTEIRKAELETKLLMIPLLILVALVIFGVTWWTVHYRKDPYNKFSPLTPTITTQVPDRHRVLLLYARDCPAFLEAVAQLRKVLKRACNCEVMDCWEESQYQNVAQGPAHWLMSNLSHSKVRTVLVTSPASILFETCMVNGSRVCYQQPKAFDCVLAQALNSLHETYSHETYKSLFIVRLDPREEGMLQRPGTCLNPLTTYELPIHLNALLANLQNMNPTECSFLKDMEPDVSLLTNAISEYRGYLSNHPRYLDSLLVTENGTTVHSVRE